MHKKHGPWTILSATTTYENPWMKVREDQVLRPDGNPGIFGVVTMKAGVSVLPYDEKRKMVYLTKEFHYALGRYSVEAVSGGIDGSETANAAAVRELREELGITANKWENLGRTDPFTTAIDCPSWLFLATDLHFGAASPDATEEIEMVELPFKKAVDMALSGEITHSPSALLILKAAFFLK